MIRKLEQKVKCLLEASVYLLWPLSCQCHNIKKIQVKSVKSDSLVTITTLLLTLLVKLNRYEKLPTQSEFSFPAQPYPYAFFLHFESKHYYHLVQK